MSKLISAELTRLRKNKLFWLCIITVFAVSAIGIHGECLTAIKDGASDYKYTLDMFFFECTPIIGIFLAAFSSLFFGTEYSDGTIRNKITVGHTRSSIYISKFIISLIAAFPIVIAMLAGASIGAFYLDIGEAGISGYVMCILLYIVSVIAICAILTFCEMLTSNKAASAVLCLILILILIIGASVIYNILQQPEMNSGYELTVEGGLQLMEPTPNPNYVSGFTRKVYVFLIDFLPTGQQIQIANFEVIHCVRMVISSVLITILTTLGGCYLFNKKDLK